MNKLLENNMYVRIISLILATILWFYVVNDQEPQVQKTFTIPIEYKNVSDGLKVEAKTKKVEVQIINWNSILLPVSEEDISAEIDLNGVEPGTYTLPVEINSPMSATVTSFEPKKVSVLVDRE